MTQYRPPTRPDLTADQILDRMNAGERLRWVVGSMIGLNPKERYLRLGNDMLTDDEGCEVMALERTGKIRRTKRDPENRSAVIDYEVTL